MWRFIKRVEEPSKKRKSTEDKLNYFKDYDKNRKRQYNIDWEKFYDWLKDSEWTGQMEEYTQKN
jgi:Ca2+-binding EF-hand superfamily protein